MTKSPTRELRRKRTKNRRRASGTFTITTANMSSPLCSIGRQTLQVGVMSSIPAPLMTSTVIN